jgi:hypothetical protein
VLVGSFPFPVRGFTQAKMEFAALLQAQGCHVAYIDFKAIMNNVLSFLSIRYSGSRTCYAEPSRRKKGLARRYDSGS